MKHHVPVDGNDELLGRLSIPTLCGRRVADVWLLWEGASELVKDHYGCKSCLRIAGTRQPPDQRQEATE